MEAPGFYAADPPCVGDVHQTGRVEGAAGQQGFAFNAFRGTEPSVSILKMLSCLRQRTSGRRTVKEPGENFHGVESDDKNILYMGREVKKKPASFLSAGDAFVDPREPGSS